MLTEFVREATDGEDEVRTKDLVDLACKRFQGDAEFAEAAARDLIPALLPDIVEGLFHRRKNDMVAVASGYVSKRKVELTARERLMNVYEGTGTGTRKALLACTKRELLALAERDRTNVVEPTLRWIAFREDLAARMNDKQVVGDLAGRVLQTVWNAHFKPESD
ncbi:MAG: hypothetical protein IT374_08990 [Polyangiaceae bacterium]|nr:hypothetical protein [Polyangiaceae bacterium]